MGEREEIVRDTSLKISEDLSNIASHLGVTKNALIKKHIPELLNKYPANYKLPVEEQKCYKKVPRIAVRGISPKTKDEIKNIAINIGINKTAFMKFVLFEIREMYPEEKRVPYKDEL